MRALELLSPGANAEEGAKNLRVCEKPVPQPGRGEVLVRVEAAPCNPSDLGFLSGSYEIDRPLPAVPGFECSGVVVAASGLPGSLLVGRRVTTGGQGRGDGTWAEYFRAPVMQVIPLLPGVDFEQGCALIVNPMTAFGLLTRAEEHGSRAIIQNAAASQLGGMVRALAAERRTPVIDIVRRAEHVLRLRSTGAQYVLDSSAPGFSEELARLAGELGATTAFDAVGGSMTAVLLGALPPTGQVIVYASLSGEPISNIESRDVVFRGKSVTGFHLGRHVAEIGMGGAMRDAWRVQRAVRRGTIRMDIRTRVSLEEAPDAIASYARSMTDGKVLILPAR